MMLRLLCASSIGMTLLMGQSLFAQGPPPGKDSVKKLQAELDALKLRIQDLEARLDKARGDFEKKPGFGKGKGKGKGPDGFGPPGFGKGKGPKGEFGKGPPWGKGPPPKGEFGKGPPWWGKGWAKGYWRKPGEFGKGRDRRPGEYGKGKGPRPGDRREEPRAGSVSNAEILRTLDRIIREIEDLRRMIRR
jgi:hypothetical protein